VCFCPPGGWSLLDGKYVVFMAVTAVSHTASGLRTMRIVDGSLETIDREERRKE
jgi:hypothetical protein